MRLKLTLLLCVLSAPLMAQEPRTAIHPADTITVTARTPVTPVLSANTDLGAPIIYPNPLPPMRLAEIARTYRLFHAAAPKAVRVANDDQPIVAEEPKGEKQ